MLFIRRGGAHNLGVAFCAMNVSGSCGDTPKSRPVEACEFTAFADRR